MADQKRSKVHISALIPPIMKFFQAFIIFLKSSSSNLIFYLILEFNMAAKIQNGCQKVIKFYKLVIKLSVYGFIQEDVHFFLLER